MHCQAIASCGHSGGLSLAGQPSQRPHSRPLGGRSTRLRPFPARFKRASPGPDKPSWQRYRELNQSLGSDGPSKADGTPDSSSFRSSDLGSEGSSGSSSGGMPGSMWGRLVGLSAPGGASTSAGGTTAGGSRLGRLQLQLPKLPRLALPQALPPVAGAVPRWVALALLPTAVWCISWALTGGLTLLADACMSAMVAVARLLHPVLPANGLEYEDIAVMLLKALESSDDAAWSRPGLPVPARVLQLAMWLQYGAAVASVGVAKALVKVPAIDAAVWLSRGAMLAICCIWMMPLGTWAKAAWDKALPSRRLPTLDSTATLCLRLAGTVAWPCITATAHFTFNRDFVMASQYPAAGIQVTAAVGSLVLLAYTAWAVGCTAVRVAQQQAASDEVLRLGRRVGLIAATQAALNMLDVGLGLASNQLQPADVGMAVVGLLVLGRIAWTAWALRGERSTTTWAHMLSVDPKDVATWRQTLGGGGDRGSSPPSGGSSTSIKKRQWW